MKELQESKDKIQKICDSLRVQTIEPAKQEAKEILENAHMEAQEIKDKAKQEAKENIDRSFKEIEKKKKLLETSLALASRQAIDVLKQEIENKFFQENLSSLVEKNMVDPKTIASLIEALVKALEKEGTGADFTVYIAQSVSPEKVAQFLTKDILDKLQDQKPLKGDFLGGVKIVLKDKKITLDVSEKELKDLIAAYIRKDFRQLIFGL